MGKGSRFWTWKRLARWSILMGFVGFVSDLVNLMAYLRLFGTRPPEGRIVYESYPPRSLPGCAFSEVLKEEGEPGLLLNIFNWLPTLSAAEEDAYARAEMKIWKGLALGGDSSVNIDRWTRGLSSEQIARIRHELVDKRGLVYIHKEFYFDSKGYHAEITMGRPKEILTATRNSGCEVDLERGESEYDAFLEPFTCDDLEQAIKSGTRRILASNTDDRCWVTTSYETDFQSMNVRFEVEYFRRHEEHAEEEGLNVEELLGY